MHIAIVHYENIILILKCSCIITHSIYFYFLYNNSFYSNLQLIDFTLFSCAIVDNYIIIYVVCKLNSKNKIFNLDNYLTFKNTHLIIYIYMYII